MKKCLTILFALMCLAEGMVCHAQNASVTYTYDMCGNRITRTLEFMKSEEHTQDNENGDKGWLPQASDTIEGHVLSLYPNPTDGVFCLALSEISSAMQVQLCTSDGVIIETRTVTCIHEKFDLRDKPAGIYLLHIATGNEKQTWKIIKKH